MSDRIIVQFDNVSFKYHEEDSWVLKDCSFTLYEGEWVAIIGHNGSGKSTIAKLMNGLLFPTKGNIYIYGRKITPKSVWDIRKNIGLVFQNPDNQFVGTTVRDDVAFGMENQGVPRKKMKERIDEMLAVVEMSDYEMTEPHRLSGGQKQRVAIASVLATQPNILILDEATAMLDPRGRSEIMRTVTQLQSKHNLSLVTITHDLDEIAPSEKVIILNQGEIWDITTPRDVFAKGTKLQKIGLDIPFVTKLASELKQVGLSLPNEPLHERELLEDLWTLHSKM